MNVDVIIDNECNNSKIVIYTDKMSDEISHIVDILKNENDSQLYGFIQDKLYFLNFQNIFFIYSENGKIFAKTDDNIYQLTYRLYQLEEILDKNFIRISNSEIINIQKVKNLDFSIIGTIKINFINGTYTFASRRFIKKIKEYLKI